MKFKTLTRVAIRTLEARVRDVFGWPIRPYKALLELTSECNSRCTTCHIWKTPHSVKAKELKIEEIEKLFRELGPDLVWLALSGGEVTLVPHFPKVIELAKTYCPKLSIITFTTNGLMPEKAVEFAQYIKKAKLDLFITVSLDGDETTHDAIRGVPGNHELALKTLGLLREACIESHYGITLGDQNEKFVQKDFQDYRGEIKAVTFLASQGIYRKENAVDDEVILNSLKTVLKYYRVQSPGQMIEWIYLKLALIFLSSSRKEQPIPCDVLKTSVHIRPDGEVLPCMFMPAVGNIRTNSWKDILGGSRAQKSLLEIRASACPRCWMNCYAPHSIMSRPLLSTFRAISR